MKYILGYLWNNFQLLFTKAFSTTFFIFFFLTQIHSKQLTPPPHARLTKPTTKNVNTAIYPVSEIFSREITLNSFQLHK